MNQGPEPGKFKSKLWFLYGLILIAIVGVSLALRVIPMYTAVLGSGFVDLQGVDGIYHLRLVENLLAHFPLRISFDPYTSFPYGQDVFFAPLFDLLAGFCAWVIGFGSPDQHTIEVVAAWFPAVLGALVCIPVFFIGKALFNKNVGLISALIIGILPGTFLFRSRLGFFDHHVTEILFSTLFILFLLLALEHINHHPLSFSDIRRKNWKNLRMPLLFSCLRGISLGSYLLAWVGGLLFVFLLFCWIILILIIYHLKKQSPEGICIISVPIFLLALLMVIPFLDQIAFSELYVVSLLTGLIGLLVLLAVSKYMDTKNVGRIYYPTSIVVIGIIGFAVLYVFFPSVAHSILDKFQVFKPDENLLTVAEVQPIFFSQGDFTLAKFWNEFSTSSIIAPLGLIVLVVGVFRKFTSGKLLFLLWSILMFLATVGQNRFAAYLAVVFAILCGYFYGETINWIKRFFNWLFLRTLKESSKSITHSKHKLREQARSKREKALRLQEDKAQPKASRAGVSRLLALSISIILVFLVGIYPNIKPALSQAGPAAGIPGDWRESLLWMKNNTPDPFQDPDFYYQLYKKPADGKYVYPASAYGVMAWWDYGHMITEIAHRIPNANPHQYGAASAGKYFVSQNELDANKMLDELGTRYVIVNIDIAIPVNIANNMLVGKKFYAMPVWAGQDPASYYEIFYQQTGNKVTPIPIYYPEYYYCLSSRLYNFHGSAVVPQNSTTIISFVEQSGMKVIQSSQTFPTYEEAKSFLKAQSSPNYRLVGTSPFSSPVPLEKLAHYTEVYRSNSGITYNNQKTNVSSIEIFEYVP